MSYKTALSGENKLGYDSILTIRIKNSQLLSSVGNCTEGESSSTPIQDNMSVSLTNNNNNVNDLLPVHEALAGDIPITQEIPIRTCSDGTQIRSTELLDFLLLQEREFAPDPLFLDRHKYVTSHMRTVLFHWLSGVSSELFFERSTYHLSLALVDRYLHISGCANLYLQRKGIREGTIYPNSPGLLEDTFTIDPITGEKIYFPPDTTLIELFGPYECCFPPADLTSQDSQSDMSSVLSSSSSVSSATTSSQLSIPAPLEEKKTVNPYSIIEITRRNFQLLGISCLYIASKIAECSPLKRNTFSLVTDYSFTSSHIYTMELCILRTLNWTLHLPNVSSFARLYLKILIQYTAQMHGFYLTNTNHNVVATGEFPPALIANVSQSANMTNDTTNNNLPSFSSSFTSCDYIPLSNPMSVLNTKKIAQVTSKETNSFLDYLESPYLSFYHALDKNYITTETPDKYRSLFVVSNEIPTTDTLYTLGHLWHTSKTIAPTDEISDLELLSAIEKNISIDSDMSISSVDNRIASNPGSNSDIVGSLDTMSITTASPDLAMNALNMIETEYKNNLSNITSNLSYSPFNCKISSSIDNCTVDPSCTELHQKKLQTMSNHLASFLELYHDTKLYTDGISTSSNVNCAKNTFNGTSFVDCDSSSLIPPSEEQRNIYSIKQPWLVPPPSVFLASHRWYRLMELLDAVLLDIECVFIPASSLVCAVISLVYPESRVVCPWLFNRSKLSPALVFVSRFLDLPYNPTGLHPAPLSKRYVSQESAYLIQTHNPDSLQFVLHLVDNYPKYSNLLNQDLVDCWKSIIKKV